MKGVYQLALQLDVVGLRSGEGRAEEPESLRAKQQGEVVK